MKKQTSVPLVAVTVPPEQRDRIAANLIAWYRKHKRDLPWRSASAYAVWVSEIMLQQTQVVTVIPYFLRFMARFPTVESLASAPIDDVLHHWAGLGYYARARNLHRAAQKIVAEHSGRLPDRADIIETLPGIGRYTAGAILSIAYDVPRPLVDANVIRVLSRVFGLRGDPKSAPNQAALWSLAEQLVPERGPGDFNQGLMELGALICRPDEPLCERCPLLADCIAGNSPDPTALPEIPPGRAAVTVAHSSAIVMREGEKEDGKEEAFRFRNVDESQSGEQTSAQALSLEGEGCARVKTSALPDPPQPEFLLVQRPMHGLWGGLWEFPRVVCEKGEEPLAAAVRAAREVARIDVAVSKRVGLVKHSVTHHRITLYGFLARSTPESREALPLNCAAVRWIPLRDLNSYALSAPQVLLREALKEYLRAAISANIQPSLEL